MKSKTLLIIVVVLTALISIGLAIWQRQALDPQQVAPSPSFAEVSASPSQNPTVSPDPTIPPTATPDLDIEEGDPNSNTPNPSGAAFTVSINGKTIAIAHGVSEATLDKGPGWLESSAVPGQDGMCVIYGHRNRTHLRILETVEASDNIIVTMPDGAVYNYIITQVKVFESTTELKLPTVEGKSIVLITCYPFRYSGHAPGKYLVMGVLDTEVTN